MRSLQAKRGTSGQVLVITSLLVVMLILSTVIYVRETEMDAPHSLFPSNLSLMALKQAIRHTVISALANVSNGGVSSVLEANLNQLHYVVANSSYSAVVNMNYTALNDGAYNEGFWISWLSNGTGISSAYISVNLCSSTVYANFSSAFSVNVTSKVVVRGEYSLLAETNKQVNVTCTFFNEGNYALAKNFTVYYEYDGLLSTEEWLTPAASDVLDYGNGTYFCSFTATTKQRDDPLLISVRGVDTRGILTVANVTCTLR
ncbi:MAG: hypothetical protein N3D85_04960 [Candidatus Bathyarchaeota archaeon]|nr:hypothetical protein [Candidatus Bathyarchaeota archaeon]